MTSPKKPSTRRRTPKIPFAFEDMAIRAGTSVTVELPIARLPTGTWSNMPVVVVHGKRPGPTIWLSGALHGDELNGVAIIRELLRTLVPSKLAGTIIAVPIVNGFGVTIGSRYLPDRRDLNRSFPGSARGSLAGRLAHTFFEKIAKRCQFGIDFHTGANGRDNLPQIRCDLDDPETARLAAVFGAPLVLNANLRDGSLRAAARQHDVKVLLYEAGEALRFGEDAIQVGVAGTERVLHDLGMLTAPPSPPPSPTVTSRSSKWARAGRSGFCHLRVTLGQHVEVGQHLATISDTVGKHQRPVRSRHAGVVIGVLRTALVHRGDALVHIALSDAPTAPQSPRPLAAQ